MSGGCSVAESLMRAAWYERGGPAAQVLQVGELPIPEPAVGEVRVAIRVSGINPGDTKKRSAWLGDALPWPRVIPHSDGAGVIEAVGEGVDSARVGERVWVFGAQSYRPFGTAAEFCCAPAEQAVSLADTISDEAGACLGIPGITAHRAVFADGPVDGLAVLVSGVRGAVESMAAQLAVDAGARVIGTVRRSSDRPDEGDAASGLAGLAGVVALDQEGVAERILELAGGKVDRIVEVDFAGNLALDQSVIAVGGVIAAYGTSDARPSLDFWPLLFDNVVIRLLGSDDFPAEAKVAAAGALTDALERGALRVQVREVLPLAEVARAHDLVDAGSRRRVLLRV